MSAGMVVRLIGLLLVGIAALFGVSMIQTPVGFMLVLVGGFALGRGQSWNGVFRDKR